MIARVGLALAAFAIGGWLALGYQSARDRDAGERLLRAPLAAYVTKGRPAGQGRADLERGATLIRRAGRLNPDSTLDLDSATFQLLLGRRDQAVRSFSELTRREPENLQAWLALALATNGYRPSLAAEARRRAAVLDPVRLRRR
jgi:predicted Zn-dependent protease